MTSPGSLPVQAVVLADIAVIVAVCAVLTRLLGGLHQPPVVAEITTGLLLGPSVLGLFPGDLPGRLFPEAARLPLSAVAGLGLVLLMFLCGWELDTRQLRGSRGTVGVVAALAMALPFTLGGGFAALLQLREPARGDPTASVLFLATAFSITAFPVLARILRDERLNRTRAGALAMSCAALGDVAAWCVLVLVTAMAGPGRAADFWVVLALTAVFALVMLLAVRPVLHRLLAGPAARGNDGAAAALVLCGLLLSAFATSWIGIHPIFGAFAFGLLMPRRSGAGLQRGADLLHGVKLPLERTAALLLPVFFVLTGLSVDVRHLGPSGLLLAVAALAVASAGKYLGAALPARLAGLGGREALAFGTLMNTRGLTEIVVLGIGRQLGLISGEVFTVMVLVALVATALTGPLLRLLRITPPAPPSLGFSAQRTPVDATAAAPPTREVQAA